MGLNERSFWRLSLLAILTLVMVMSVTWWVDPVRAYQLRQEGALFQDLTVVLFLLASGVAVFFIYTRKPGLIYLMIPVFGVLFAGEELSWIERIIESPVIKGVRIDALHDFAEVTIIWLHLPVWAIAVVVVGIITSTNCGDCSRLPLPPPIRAALNRILTILNHKPLVIPKADIRYEDFYAF